MTDAKRDATRRAVGMGALTLGLQAFVAGMYLRAALSENAGRMDWFCFACFGFSAVASGVTLQ